MLNLGATVTHSDCKNKGFLKTGTAAGQGAVEAPWVTCFGHFWAQRFMWGHTMGEEGSSGAIPQTRWDHRNLGSTSPGALIPLKGAGINVELSGLEAEAVGWLGGCSHCQQ